MKKVFLLIGLISLANIAYCQTKSYTDSSVLKDNGKLVSNYTFRRLIQKDFSKITTGDNGFSKVGKYATLDVNSDESKFYFSPLVFVSKQDPLDGSFKRVHSIDISGSINSSNIFDFKKKNTVTLGYSLTIVCDNYKYNPDDNDKDLKLKIREAAIKKMEKIGAAANDNVLDKLDNADILSDPKKYKKKLLETIADYEENWAADLWTRKRINWWKFNLNAVSFDNFYIVDNGNTGSYESPISKSLFTPSLNVSFNSLKTYTKKNMQLYYSGWVKLGIKHSLSEFSETSEWIKFQKLTDLTYITADKNDVYAIPESDLKSKLKPDIGAQLTWLFNINPAIKTGIDVSATYKSIVSSVNNSNAIKLSVGVIFPFTDKNGETSINIEPFYAYTRFSNIDMANKNFWGVRFGLPFTRP